MSIEQLSAVADEAEQLSVRLKELQDEVVSLSRRRVELMRVLVWDFGLSYKMVGARLGISGGRVWQMVGNLGPVDDGAR